jgi:hypothetical protein
MSHFSVAPTFLSVLAFGGLSEANGRTLNIHSSGWFRPASLRFGVGSERTDRNVGATNQTPCLFFGGTDIPVGACIRRSERSERPPTQQGIPRLVPTRFAALRGRL